MKGPPGVCFATRCSCHKSEHTRLARNSHARCMRSTCREVYCKAYTQWGPVLDPVLASIFRSAAGCTGGHAVTKLEPSISPLQEVANRAHVSKRDQFWDQFRGAGSGVSFRIGKSSSRQRFRVRLYEKTYTRHLSVQKLILATKTSSR
jgi:hypothetical protein